MFHIVYISTTKYHYRGQKFNTLPEAFNFMKDNFSHTFGSVIHDGSSGKRYCLREAEKLVKA